MTENQLLEKAENTRQEASPAPAPAPDSIPKALLQYIWNQHPVVKWGAIIFTVIVFFIVAIWDRLPTTWREHAMEQIFSNTFRQLPEPSENNIGLKHIKSELMHKDLLHKLEAADGYTGIGGASENKEAALRLYKEVLAQLSPEATRELDQDLLAKAKSDTRAGHLDDANLKFKTLFDKIRDEK